MSDAEKTCRAGHGYSGKNCRECNRIKNVAWRAKNREKVNAISAAYAARHPEKVKESRQSWVSKNKEWIRVSGAERYERNRAKQQFSARVRAAGYREGLSDSYVASVLDLRLDQVPKNLLELKRVQLQITRKLKELKK